jgi:RNA polymerase sigma factor (sigma-70 family)
VTGRQQQFEVLYSEHQSDVLAFFLRRLEREEAVEAAADVFVTAWRRIDDVPVGTDGRRWLFGVARNELRNHERSVRRRVRLAARVGVEPVVSPAIPETVVVRHEEEEETLEALDRLTSRDREVVLLRLWEEASFDDIAAIVGCSRHAAEQRYGAALKRFRSALRQAGHVGGKGPSGPTRQEQAHEG